MWVSRYYVTPKDYEVAKQNGIDEQRVYTRVYMHGWNIERAITEPVRSYNDLSKYANLAKRNNISYNTFYERVRRGMQPRKAATTPVKTSKEISKIMQKRKKTKLKYPKWVYEKAEKNNIKIGTLSSRIDKWNWTYEDACTIPPRKRRTSTKNHVWRDFEKSRYKEMKAQ